MLEQTGIRARLQSRRGADLAALLAQPVRTRSQALLQTWNVRERLATAQSA